MRIFHDKKYLFEYLKALKEVLEKTLCRYEITGSTAVPEIDDSNKLIEMFIAAKRIEGCSEKTDCVSNGRVREYRLRESFIQFQGNYPKFPGVFVSTRRST